ncbi:NAD(P)/FAD-dependent oxidoreductase [Pseudomonas sp.]|uniref:NAD(P)/FAD-dependent oxidoreductase n=1 Tax=Pseudomonas sp. TaxID=306 RepID=UPI003A96E0B2
MNYDAIVIGGSFAGLSAAIYIARARRTVCVIDSGAPRNRFAGASHGFFGQDGQQPQAMISAAKQQLANYPNARIINGYATAAEQMSDGFTVQLASAEVLCATKLVLAFGVSDVLPETPGLASCWGVSLLHCPYCHGYEFANKRLGVLYAGPGSYRHATLISEWGPTTLYLNGHDDPDQDALAALTKRGIAIEPAGISAAIAEDGQLSALQLEEGRHSSIDALYIHAHTKLSSSLAEQLGCALEDGPFGPLVRTDANKLTSVPGVYAAGDIARAPHNATWAAADGVTAGTALHQALVFD